MQPKYCHPGNAMKCRRCGSEERDEATICDNCGNRLSGEDIEAEWGRETPLFISGHLLWFDRFSLLVLMGFFGTVVLIFSIIGGGTFGKLISLSVVAIGWLAIYYILWHRRQK